MTTAPKGGSRLPDAITDPVTGRRISLLDWKATNLRASWLLGLVMVVLLGGLGWLIGFAIDPGLAGVVVVIAVVFALGQTAAAYWASDTMVLSVAGARPATQDEHRYLVNVSEAVAIGAGVPTPRVYVIDNPAPNAFATGRDPKHGTIAVTTGLMEILDRQELEAVVAHEIAHIRNYDIRFMSMLAATVGAIVLLRDVALRSMRFGGVARRRGGGSSGGGRGQIIAIVALVVLLVLAPLLAMALRMAVSRRREYLADATGAYITRNPEGLARALEKLRDFRGPPMQVSEGVAHMFFTNPALKRNANGWFATHPPLQDRINRLRRM
ncbi:MAG: zinc metalloprotease HtpX [Trueperaceae bacterium]|nr:MAG: zinc metalloprotease HtpX [Trueperaceae bacterium]